MPYPCRTLYHAHAHRMFHEYTAKLLLPRDVCGGVSIREKEAGWAKFNMRMVARCRANKWVHEPVLRCTSAQCFVNIAQAAPVVAPDPMRDWAPIACSATHPLRSAIP